jgi:hypothetical protein
MNLNGGSFQISDMRVEVTYTVLVAEFIPRGYAVVFDTSQGMRLPVDAEDMAGYTGFAVCDIPEGEFVTYRPVDKSWGLADGSLAIAGRIDR